MRHKNVRTSSLPMGLGPPPRKSTSDDMTNTLAEVQEEEEMYPGEEGMYTVEPLNKGHCGAKDFGPCREVVPFSEVK